MDNKITKERIGTHLEYEWFKYVLLFFVIIAVWIFVFEQINKLQKYEKIAIFVLAQGYKNDSTDEKLLAKLSDNNDTVVQQITINKRYVSDDNSTVWSLLTTQATDESDIVILPQGYAVDGGFALEVAAHIDIDTIEYITQDNSTYQLEFYRDDEENIMAIRVDNWMHISNFIVTEQENENADKYYLMLNKNSYNIGRLGSNSSEYTQAIDIIKYLLELYY